MISVMKCYNFVVMLYNFLVNWYLLTANINDRVLCTSWSKQLLDGTTRSWRRKW